jgi:hypothetical protein
MLDAAININVDHEIEKFIRGARQYNIEESKGTEIDYQESIQSTIEDGKRKKKVNFASPERFSSVHSYTESSVSGSKSKFSAHKMEDSIGESIKIEESYTVSNNTSQPYESSKRTEKSDYIKESVKD